jgi:hypothetical protein
VNQKSGLIGWKIWAKSCLFRSQRAERRLLSCSARQFAALWMGEGDFDESCV